MGLDMYLSKKHYIGNKWKEPKDQVKLGLPFIKDERLSEITEQVGYWRKANQIHKWFVDNVQDGQDDCKEYYVSREKLEELLKVVTEVLGAMTLVEGDVVESYTIGKNLEKIPNTRKGKVVKDTKVAEELLPGSEGFFFGGTEYDEYYVRQLEETKTMLEGLLAEEDNGDYYYQSSW